MVFIIGLFFGYAFTSTFTEHSSVNLYYRFSDSTIANGWKANRVYGEGKPDSFMYYKGKIFAYDEMEKSTK